MHMLLSGRALACRARLGGFDPRHVRQLVFLMSVISQLKAVAEASATSYMTWT